MRVSVYHNVAPDIATRMVYGYQPGQPLVHVFQTDISPADGGTGADELADWIWTACNIGHELDMAPRLQAVGTAYRHCGLRSLSFPGKLPCCGRPCCSHRYEVWPRSSGRPRRSVPKSSGGLQR